MLLANLVIYFGWFERWNPEIGDQNEKGHKPERLVARISESSDPLLFLRRVMDYMTEDKYLRFRKKLLRDELAIFLRIASLKSSPTGDRDAELLTLIASFGWESIASQPATQSLATYRRELERNGGKQMPAMITTLELVHVRKRLSKKFRREIQFVCEQIV